MESLRRHLPVLLRNLRKPGFEHLIIVRPGIAHRVLRPTVRGIIRLLPGVKGELQDLHPGKARIPHKLPHRIRHIAEVLRDDPLLPERLLKRPEKLDPRPLLPSPAPRVLIPARDGEILVEAPEMIHADDIIERKAVPHPLNPPAIAALSVILPIVEGIPPELAVRRKGIRGAARNPKGLSLGAQLKKLRIREKIRGILRHIDRNIADQLDPSLIDIALQPPPLLPKLILQKAVEILAVSALLRHKSGVAGKPELLLLQKFLVGLPLRFPRLLPAEPSLEAGIGLSEERIAKAVLPLIGDPPFRLREFPAPVLFLSRSLLRFFLQPRLFTLLLREESLPDQSRKINEIGIPRKGRKALIGRIPVAGRPQGQNLPVALPGLRKKIRKTEGLLSEASDPISSGQRKNREQNSRSPFPARLSALRPAAILPESIPLQIFFHCHRFLLFPLSYPNTFGME